MAPGRRRPVPRLDDATRTRLAAALDREGVVSVALFGSQAEGSAGPLSDVDLAVWLDPELSVSARLDARLELASAAADALGGTEVDLVILNDASPLLRHRARRGAVLLVDRNPRTRVRLEAGALVDYLDTQPLRDELDRGLHNRMAEGRFGRR